MDKDGDYKLPTWGDPPEYPFLTFESGIAEVHDMLEKEEITFSEIVSINSQSVEYSPEINITKVYKNFHDIGMVVEFAQD